MTLSLEVAPTISGRGAVSVTLYIPDPDLPDDVQAGYLTVQIKRSDGQVIERRFDLLERLTDDAAGTNTHLPALVALRDYILARIDSEILGL